MSAKKSQTAKVPTYYVGMQLILCCGILDKITQIQVGEKAVLTAPILGTGLTFINQPELFGGMSREGGIIGILETAFGNADQMPSAYLTTVLGESISAYRGLSQIILRQMYIGTNYYMKPWQIRSATRITKRAKSIAQWYSATMSPIVDNINAVHVLRECLTDVEWGISVPEAQIDVDSWEFAALTCYNEGLGFSFLWAKDSTIEAFMDEVAQHIQASVYKDRATGIWKIKLLRPETFTSGHLLLTDQNTVKLASLNRRTLADCISEILIKYENNGTFKPAEYRAVNYALIARQGASILKTTEYSGCSTKRVSKILGDRDLWQLGLPSYSGTVICNREAENLNPGDLFALEYPSVLGAIRLYLRVKSINLGTAKDEAITIDFFEDFFSSPASIFSADPEDDFTETRWASPTVPPIAITSRALVEIPYYAVALWEGDSVAQSTPPMQTGYVAVAKSPTAASIDAQLWATTGATFDQRGTLDFSYWAQTTIAVDRLAVDITLDSATDIETLAVNTFALLGTELVYVRAIAFPIITVKRGILDTVPEAHPIGTDFIGIENFHGLDTTQYVAGQLVSTKLLTVTAGGTLLLASAPADTITLVGRMHLPYPPGNLLINGEYWRTSRPHTLNLSWASRNRILQTSTPVSYYTSNITPEAGVTYTIETRNISGGLLLSATTSSLSISLNLSALTFTDFGQIRIFSTNTNGDSFQPVIHNFTAVDPAVLTMDSTTATLDSTTITLDSL